MKDAGVTVIYCGGLHTEAGLIMRQARRPGPQGTVHVGRRHRVERAGLDRRRRRQRHADDVRSGSAQEPGQQGSGREVPGAGFEPEAYTLYSYAALQVVAAAAAKAGSNDAAEGRRDHQDGRPFDRLGEIGFDEKGDITRPDYVMYQWKKGDDGKFSYFEMN